MTSPPPDGPSPGASALVTGASGFTGSVLVRRLVERGVRVTAIARRGSKVDHLADLQVAWVRGEIDAAATVARADDDYQRRTKARPSRTAPSIRRSCGGSSASRRAAARTTGLAETARWYVEQGWLSGRTSN